jgi:hypothetical protein
MRCQGRTEGEEYANRPNRGRDDTEEVLLRQAKARAERTGEPLAEALEAVLETEAGRQLRELGGGPHRHKRAQDWQEGLARERVAEQLRYIAGINTPREALGASPLPVDGRYSWMETFLLEWLEGKEAREEYYVRLDQEQPSGRKE